MQNDADAENLLMACQSKSGRPIPDAADSIADLCKQIGEAVTLLTSGAVVEVKPAANLFPDWRVEIRLLQFPK